MIISKKTNNYISDFEDLLNNLRSNLKNVVTKDEQYFLSRSGVKLEKDVFEKILILSKSTPFEGSFELISGQRFPDIVAYVNDNLGLGIEVKTSSQNHWKTTGSSIYESTRVENINHIYLLFGKLVSPVDFKIRRYEECLYDVAVTHSPRYLIDMDTNPKATIFSKIDIPYDDLRALRNPFKPIKDFYRKHKLSQGDDYWWIESDNEDIGVIRQWSNLSTNEKNNIRVEAFCLFPELFSSSSLKYQQLSSWLVAKHKIVSPSLRDTFTAGGQVTIIIGKKSYTNVPRIIKHLQESIDEIKEKIKQIDSDDLQYYWKNNTRLTVNNKYNIWKNLIIENSNDILLNTRLNMSDLLP